MIALRAARPGDAQAMAEVQDAIHRSPSLALAWAGDPYDVPAGWGVERDGAIAHRLDVAEG